MTGNRLVSYLAVITALCMLQACSTSKKSTSRKPGYTQEIVFRPQQPTATETHDKGQMDRLISEAHKWIGTKYRYGGQSKSGTDCSGMVMALYMDVYGIKLPRSSREQQKFCQSVNKRNLRKGDLLFFSSSKNSRSVSHVGLYIGHDRMIHASSSRGVIISDITDKYYTSTYHSSGRVVQYEKPGKRSKKAPPSQPDGSQPPSDTPTIRLEDLINTKIDSIYSSYPSGT